MKTTRIMGIACTMGLISATANAAALVGTYDEQATQANSVNQSATFATGTGGATAANVLNAATFKTAVEAAFTAGIGGVLDFDSQINIDDQVPTTGITSPVGVTFDSGSKSLDVTFSLSSGEKVFRQGNLSNRTPISASNGSTPGFALTTEDETPGTLTISFSGVDGSPLEQVSSAGFTFLSRTSRDFGVVSGVATFSGGGTATASFTNTTFTAGAQDTFFGFVAPTGQAITSISISTANEYQFSIDDLGLVTSTVPEPGSLALMGLGGFMMVLRRRSL